MLFRVRCPRCGQTAEIAEEHLGRQGQCNNCGSLVAIPARLSKICFVCGVDVTNLSHTKDENNNYVCTNCYHTRQATPQGSASGRIECSICHVHFPREQSTGPADEPICPDCSTILQAHRLPVAVPVTHQRPSLSAAATIADAPPALEDLERIRPLPRPPMPPIHAAPAPANSASRLPLILSSLALLGVIILAILHFTTRKEPAVHNVQSSQPDNSDQQALTRVLILKSQAEVLIEVGKVREGIEKYDQLLQIPSTPAIAAELESAKSARERALKILAASTTQTASPAASEKKPIADTDSLKKPRAIFDE